MNKRINKDIPEAYNGMYIKYHGKQCTLVPEVAKGYCKGCIFEDKNPNGCGSQLTDYCRQGYILKEVNV